MTTSSQIEIDSGGCSSTPWDDDGGVSNGSSTSSRHGSSSSRHRRRRALRATTLMVVAVAVPLIVASLGQVRLLRSASESSMMPSRPWSVTSSSVVADDRPSPAVVGRNTCATGYSYSLEFTRKANISRKIYTCGWNNGHFMSRSVFPEFDGPHPWTSGGNNSTPYDLMLFGAHGPCEGQTPGKVTGFKGKILYDNGESFGDPRDGGGCDYILGPIRDSNTSIRLPFVSMLLGGSYRHRSHLIYDPIQRPRNTGEYYMLYAASNCVDFRDEAAAAFSKVGRSPLHLGGKCPLNGETRSGIGVEAPGRSNHTGWGDNVDFYRRYRFALVLENTKLDGYVTEKILNAFLAGSVPVWGGTTRIFDIFNRDAFVYYDPQNNPEKAVELVRRLENNRTLYEEMLSRPILANGDETVAKYFSFEDGGLGGGRLRARIRRMLGLER